jgi:transcriptional regulator GlxA family with amidase domain
MSRPSIPQLALSRFPFYAIFLMNSATPLFPRYDPTGERPLTVGILVLDQTNMLSLAAAVDPMRAANRRAERRLFDWRFLTATDLPAQITAGFPITGQPIAAAEPPDLLLILASFRIAEQTTPALAAQIRRIARAGTALAGVDGGSQLLAASGLLDGLAATTHWEDLDDFAIRYPRVQVVRDRFRISGRMLTTGGASPCLDMMLHLIGRLHGRDLAARVASAFIYDPVQSGDAPQRLVPTATLARRDPLIARAIARLEADLDTPPSIANLAQSLGVSRRLFEQRFRAATGHSPHAFGLALRLSEARRLATDTDQPVQDIALATGFASHAAFARAFKAAYNISVSQLRRARGQRL